jgi:hypothetical protein
VLTRVLVLIGCVSGLSASRRSVRSCKRARRFLKATGIASNLSFGMLFFREPASVYCQLGPPHRECRRRRAVTPANKLADLLRTHSVPGLPHTARHWYCVLSPFPFFEDVREYWQFPPDTTNADPLGLWDLRIDQKASAFADPHSPRLEGRPNNLLLQILYSKAAASDLQATKISLPHVLNLVSMLDCNATWKEKKRDPVFFLSHVYAISKDTAGVNTRGRLLGKPKFACKSGLPPPFVGHPSVCTVPTICKE